MNHDGRVVRFTDKYADRRGIFVRKADDPSVVVPELGHALETTYPGLHEAVMSLYNRRTAGEPLISMNAATGMRGYNSDERTKVDKWMHAYMGKQYDRPGYDRYGERRPGATELVSMALEYMHSRPHELIKKDYELFSTVINHIRKPRR